MIPKLLHRIWLSYDNTLYDNNERILKCIESQNKYASDFKIMEWNNDCIDYYMQFPLFKYYFNEVKNLAYCSDIIRLDALYRFGGIYLDTDVMLLNNLNNDLVLNNNFFCGLECVNNPNYLISYNNKNYNISNAIIGCEKNNKIIKDILDYTLVQSYKDVNSNGVYFITNYIYNQNYKIIKTFKELQNINNDNIIPVFKPYNLDRQNNSESTCDVEIFHHMFTFSWKKFL